MGVRPVAMAGASIGAIIGGLIGNAAGNRGNRTATTVAGVIAVIGFVAVLEVWGVDAIVWFYGGQIGSRLLSACATVAIAALAAAAIWEIA